jgi:hypothetical protein
MITDDGGIGAFEMNLDGLDPERSASQEFLDEFAARLFRSLRASTAKLGRFRQVAVLLASNRVIVVGCPSGLPASEATEAWARRLRVLAKELEVSATFVATSTKLRWRTGDEGGEGKRVVLVTVDHSALGQQQWVAPLERVGREESVGEHRSLLEEARAAFPERGIGRVNVTGLAKPLRMIMPQRWAN